MKSLAWRSALLLVLVFTSCPAAGLAAGSLRCGSRLVGPGQWIEDVYELCGEPTDRTASTEFVTVRVSRDVAVTRAIAIEEWTYNLGPKQFVRYLEFHNGRLVHIDEGTYGN